MSANYSLVITTYWIGEWHSLWIIQLGPAKSQEWGTSITKKVIALIYILCSKGSEKKNLKNLSITWIWMMTQLKSIWMNFCWRLMLLQSVCFLFDMRSKIKWHFFKKLFSVPLYLCHATCWGRYARRRTYQSAFPTGQVHWKGRSYLIIKNVLPTPEYR